MTEKEMIPPIGRPRKQVMQAVYAWQAMTVRPENCHWIYVQYYWYPIPLSIFVLSDVRQLFLCICVVIFEIIPLVRGCRYLEKLALIVIW